MEQFKPLILRGKNFVQPPGGESDFKELFRRMASLGAGRRVDKDGIPDGPWTPELLTEEISMLDANSAGIDLRTVQLWFQDNHKGISSTNIHWLARIFGCGDPAAISAWQAELSAAQARLVANRRHKRRTLNSKLSVETSESAVSYTTPEQVNVEQRWSVPNLSEAMFLDGRPFNAIVLMWAGLALLMYLGYIAGTHLITYNLQEGVTKQVGLFWSPNWILDKLIWLPLMVIVASTLLKQWRNEWRRSLLAEEEDRDSVADWEKKIDAHSFSFWGILFVCFAIVFLLQWYGAYLQPLLQNDAGDRVIDWLLVAIERPDVMTVSEAIPISAFANLLSGIAYWYLFAGLMLLYILASDFSEVSNVSAGYQDSELRKKAFGIGTQIIRGVFCFTVLAILTSTQIKLVSVYLMTDAEDIVGWLIGDAYAFFGLRDESWGWFDKAPSASITSFFVLFIPCFVFLACFVLVFRALQRLDPSEPTTNIRASWIGLMAILVLLVVNFWSLGRFTGFSILLVASVLIGVSGVIAQSFAKIVRY